MTLEELGYWPELEAFRLEHVLGAFEVARVTSEHKDRYTVRNTTGTFDAELIGNLRYAASDRADLPAVGDWVAISEYDDGKALIHAVYPRKSILERRAAGSTSQRQIIATNIDLALIVQSVNRDYSINRLERYLAICGAAGIEPVIVLSKTDLIDPGDLQSMISEVQARIKDVPVIGVSNETQSGIDQVRTRIGKGRTCCLLGSSGVGKSSLINSLAGTDLQETGEISAAIDRGKHVTTQRELLVFDGGILIDNPGMREVGLTDAGEGLESTFDEIAELADRCKFSDCTHTDETACAVLEALDAGGLDPEVYDNYQRMSRERSFFESSAAERKKKDKDLGKLIKNMKKQQRNKF